MCRSQGLAPPSASPMTHGCASPIAWLVDQTAPWRSTRWTTTSTFTRRGQVAAPSHQMTHRLLGRPRRCRLHGPRARPARLRMVDTSAVELPPAWQPPNHRASGSGGASLQRPRDEAPGTCAERMTRPTTTGVSRRISSTPFERHGKLLCRGPRLPDCRSPMPPCKKGYVCTHTHTQRHAPTPRQSKPIIEQPR